MDAHIVYLRSVGVKVIFLPPYCPFFNPIEYLFGYLKNYCKLNYKGKGSEKSTLCNGIANFIDYDSNIS